MAPDGDDGGLTMGEWALAFGVPGGAVWAAIVGALLAAAVVATVLELRREPNVARRRALAGLRVLSALLAWCVAAQPSALVERVERTEGGLAVLVDASRSMSLPRREARSSRARALLRRWAREAPPTLETFTFGERLEPARLAELSERLRADADASRLGDALEAIVADGAQRELGAVVVVSDGADRSGVDVARVAGSGVRVHTVGVSEEALRDDAIISAAADPVGFLRRPSRVRVRVRSVGGAGGPIPVTLRRGDEVEREVVVEVPRDGEAEVELPFTPTRLGREVYRVSIPSAPDDEVPENDERAFLVRVTRDKLRVLLVAGQPSWDERFLRAFLKRDPATDLISFFILRNTSDLTMADSGELALIPFPTDELFNEHLGSFDLVIFQNFEFGPYQMGSYLPGIRDYVLRGGSFAMVGGPLSFHSGGYSETPIAEILPVDLPPPGTPATRTLVTDAFRPRLAEGLERHPLLALLPNPGENAAAWASLAPLVGANVVLRVRPEAYTLLEHPEHRVEGGAPLPVLVAGAAGGGRTLALTTDTSWRWGITTGGLTGDDSAHERFWDRAVRWLSRDPALEPARLTTDRERYGPGASAEVTGQLATPRYAPYAERDVALRLVDASGAERARASARTDRDGRLSAVVRLPSQVGAYRVQAMLAEVSDPVAEEWLVIESGGDELANPRADPALLEGLARGTGGRFFASPEDAPQLSALDTTRTRSLGFSRVAPFATVWAFVGLFGVFFAEWVLRRRWGRR